MLKQRDQLLSQFCLPADQLAPRLLGSYLCRRFNNGQPRCYLITEVEAYVGEEDKACHAHRGKTQRTAVMYGPAGHWYVYLIYGMHYMLNLVTDKPGKPHAVLFRGVKDLTSGRLIDGPGKLTKALNIDSRFNTLPATLETNLWLKLNSAVDQSNIKRLPRVGVDYAQDWASKPLRFLLETDEGDLR